MRSKRRDKNDRKRRRGRVMRGVRNILATLRRAHNRQLRNRRSEGTEKFVTVQSAHRSPGKQG